MYEYRAKCVRVVDGDTLDLDIDLGLNVHVMERVRLAGIDTPETYGVKKDSEEYAAGLRAKERVTELVMGIAGVGVHEPSCRTELTVITQKDKAGKYGRYLVTIILPDGSYLNQILLDEGLAKPY